ncbi:hypothetical protein CH380_01855 [Leptospira adleri]|uniref:Uncharacterized protein n=1 Tax=Leptospira adleri TaxID=2023186 RepID=A0A2M9YUR1_9LEPT|nr:hypothetical protein CH380_01855 [Leptospira adleri]PJZ62436.1 hypothetical protein CH376_08020 [Leptospira adleri]
MGFSFFGKITPVPFWKKGIYISKSILLFRFRRMKPAIFFRNADCDFLSFGISFFFVLELERNQ